MALDLTPEQKATGKANFEQAAGDLGDPGMPAGELRVVPQRPTVACLATDHEGLIAERNRRSLGGALDHG